MIPHAIGARMFVGGYPSLILALPAPRVAALLDPVGERASSPAFDEMNAMGLATRKIVAATVEVRGLEITNGQVVLCAGGAAVDPLDERSVLGVSVSLSEAEAHVRDFMA